LLKAETALVLLLPSRRNINKQPYLACWTHDARQTGKQPVADRGDYRCRLEATRPEKSSLIDAAF